MVKTKEKSIYPHVADTEKIEVDYLSDEKGGWFVLEKPLKPNAIKKLGAYWEPDNKIQYQNNHAWDQHVKDNMHGFFTSDTVSYNSVPMALAQKRREVLDFTNFNYKY